MNAVFYITFYSGLGDAVQRNAFYIDRLTAPWDEMEEHLAYCAEQFEKKDYGQFDWVSGRSGAGIKNFGCNCFIDQTHSTNNQVMEAWRQNFRDAQPNCVLGPVCAMDANTKDLSKMFEKTQQAYEHQQAKQLRNTLNTKIAVVQSVAQRKKM